MTSDHNSLQSGAGNQHSPAPYLPVYAICDVCGQADEQAAMVDGMCRDCIGAVREALRADRERWVSPLDVVTALVIGFWAAVIVWRWVR